MITINLVNEDANSVAKKAERSFLAKFLYKIITRIRTKLISRFTTLHTELVGAYSLILKDAYHTTDPLEDYKQFSKTVNLISKWNEKYADIDYMDSPKLKKIMNEVLFKCYDIEAELKIKAHSKKIIPTDIKIKQAISSRNLALVAHL